MQDQKRATIVGSRTFGKASVQTIIPLGQGNGALRLTTARYYTPSGHSLQAQGVSAAFPVARLLYWSVRRELWENRAIYVAPVAVACVFLFGFSIGIFHLVVQMHAAPGLDVTQQDSAVEDKTFAVRNLNDLSREAMNLTNDTRQQMAG